MKALTRGGYYSTKLFAIRNSSISFNDGMAFCAIVAAYDPSAIDLSKLHPRNAKENLALAFQVAEEKLGIPKVVFFPTSATLLSCGPIPLRFERGIEVERLYGRYLQEQSLLEPLGRSCKPKSCCC